MRLTRKLTLALVLGIIVGVAVSDYLTIRTDIGDIQSGIADDLTLMARGLSIALAELARVSGPQAVERLVGERNQEGNVRVRWVKLDAPVGDSHSVKLTPEQSASLRSGEEVRITQSPRARDSRLIVYRPFRLEVPVQNVIEVSESLAPVRQKALRSLIAIVAKSFFIILLAAVYTLTLGARLVARPVQELVDQARRIGSGDFSRRLKLARHDELTELAGELNQMCDRLVEARDRLATENAAKVAAVEQLRHADRLKTVGQLASGVAHELGTPLNVISGHAKMISAGDGTTEENLDSARIIVEQSARITAIIRQLLDFARRGQPNLSVGNLIEVTERSVKMLGHLATQRGIEIEFHAETRSATTKMDESQIQQVLTNLILNGIQAMPSGGKIRVEVDLQEAKPPGPDGAQSHYLTVRVRDQGGGIPPDLLPRIFEPFFTTKEVGEGTGLGLSVAHGIVQEHGGFISVDSAVGAGSSFTVHLPVAS